MSKFSTIRSNNQDADDPMAAIDESKMERAFETLMKESEGINEDDPRQMASLMRKFTSQTGLNFGDAMEEAISRMEAGEDPDQIEKEMGDLLEGDDLNLESLKRKAGGAKAEPIQDEKLYYL